MVINLHITTNLTHFSCHHHHSAMNFSMPQNVRLICKRYREREKKKERGRDDDEERKNANNGKDILCNLIPAFAILYFVILCKCCENPRNIRACTEHPLFIPLLSSFPPFFSYFFAIIVHCLCQSVAFDVDATFARSFCVNGKIYLVINYPLIWIPNIFQMAKMPPKTDANYATVDKSSNRTVCRINNSIILIIIFPASCIVCDMCEYYKKSHGLLGSRVARSRETKKKSKSDCNVDNSFGAQPLQRQRHAVRRRVRLCQNRHHHRHNGGRNLLSTGWKKHIFGLIFARLHILTRGRLVSHHWQISIIAIFCFIIYT